MKILLFTDHFYPDLSSGGKLLTDLASGLVEMGNDVQVITCFASYNTNIKGFKKEEFLGVKISRIYENNFSRYNLSGRLLDEILFCIILSIKSILIKEKIDVILTLSSPPFLPFFTMIISWLKKVPYVYIVMDVFPDIAVNLGLIKKNQIITKVWHLISQIALRKSDRIIVLGRCMRKKVKSKIPDQKVPINIIPNWSNSKKNKPIAKENNPFFLDNPELKNKFIIQYSGNLGRFQDFETIINVAQKIKTNTLIHFLIIGEGFQKKWLSEEIKKRSLNNVTLLPFQPEDRLIYSLNACDIALISLKKGTEGLCVPSKFYPILAVGKPIIAIMAEWAEVALVVKGHNLGAVLAQGDTINLVKIITDLSTKPEYIEDIQQRSRNLFLKKFNRLQAIKLYNIVLSKTIAKYENSTSKS